MKFKTQMLLILMVIGLPLQMCTNPDDCNCSPPSPFFDINGMSASHIKTALDSAEVVNEGASIIYDDYLGLNLGFDVDYLTMRVKNESLNFSFMQSAYACSCIPSGGSGSKNEQLINLTVVTLNDFDEMHLANTSINDLIQVGENLFFNGDVPEDAPYVSEFLENQTGNIKSEVLRLKIDQKPMLDQNFKVKIIIELSTGEVYETNNESIIIQ